MLSYKVEAIKYSQTENRYATPLRTFLQQNYQPRSGTSGRKSIHTYNKDIMVTNRVPKAIALVLVSDETDEEGISF